MPYLKAYRMLIFGALAVGTLDIAYAFRFDEVTLLRTIRIQGISGVLGVVSLYFVAFLFVLGFWALARLWPRVLRRTGLAGPLYGIAVFLLMYYVVIPLSGLPGPRFDSGGALFFVMAESAILGMFAAMCAAAALDDERTLRRPTSRA